MNRIIRGKLIIALALCMVPAACGDKTPGAKGDEGGGKSAPDKPDKPDKPVKAGKKVDPATAGSIQGKVRFEGKVPAPRELGIAELVCSKVHKGPVYVDDVLVKDGNLKNALVFIKSGLDGYNFGPPPTEKVVLDQVGCIYKPLLAQVRVGQPFEFLNSDPILHNVHTVPKENDESNKAMASKGMRIPVKFELPEGPFKTKCDVHPWMRAYIAVFDHPYYAVTGDDGAFELKNVPAGEYKVEVWHEVYGSQIVNAKVDAKGTTTVEVVVKET